MKNVDKTREQLKRLRAKVADAEVLAEKRVCCVIAEANQQAEGREKELEAERSTTANLARQLMNERLNTARSDNQLRQANGIVNVLEVGREAVLDSLLQERADLLSRILRADQRIRAFGGPKPEVNSFELVGVNTDARGLLSQADDPSY